MNLKKLFRYFFPVPLALQDSVVMSEPEEPSECFLFTKAVCGTGEEPHIHISSVSTAIHFNEVWFYLGEGLWTKTNQALSSQEVIYNLDKATIEYLRNKYITSEIETNKDKVEKLKAKYLAKAKGVA